MKFKISDFSVVKTVASAAESQTKLAYLDINNFSPMLENKQTLETADTFYKTGCRKS